MWMEPKWQGYRVRHNLARRVRWDVRRGAYGENWAASADARHGHEDTYQP